ncbi:MULTISPECIES: PAS domain S-box protein [unclassified Leptolyngbya]|uniref:PAS domain S-box protein n=1 Tax=unclassified Leptolyngbya TaxID=2650499 RepID=UPI0016886943|nr:MULTISPECIES: PAS domain S-box protein [unclassified Leptolyngbya]MBD1911339.1 PAS domain S-box protein [Leptolyngbya sp. FACHB-8]MBD2156643.1 PAS domain S-box protein [Leptolyngbya sp. FACHB-16]
MGRRFLSYGVAIALTAIALLLSLWQAALIARTMGAFFYIAIAISTWYGGRWPGIVTIVLSALALNYYFIPPIGQISISNVDDFLRLILVIGVGLIINLLSASLQESKRAEADRTRLLQQERAAHKEVENLLQQLESERHRLEQVLQQMPVGVSIAEAPSGKLLFHNEEAIRLLHHPLLPSDTDQESIQYGGVHPNGQPYQPEEYPIARALLGNAVKAEEMYYRREDGTITTFSVSAAPILDQAGNIVSSVSTFEDISNRKQAESERKQAALALQASEERLRLLIKNSPVGIAMFDREMRYVMMSQRWVDNYHPGTIESFIGRSHYDVLPSVPDRWRQAHQRCLAGAIEKRDEDFFMGADGTPQWTRWEVRPWYIDTGEIGGIIVFSEEITQRKQAERSLQELNQSLERRVAERTAELRTSEAQIRAIIEAIPDLLLRVTRDGTCLDRIRPHNQTDENFSTLNHLSELLPPELLQQQLIRIEQAIATKTLQIYEHQVQGGTGPVYEEVRIVGINANEALIIVRDISARKQAELALQESQHFIQQIADASPNILYVFDLEQQRNLYSNREVAAVMGYTPDEIQAMGSTFLQTLMHPDDLARLPEHQAYIRNSQNNEIIEFEYRMRQATGEWCWLYGRDTVFKRDAEGRVQQIIGTAQDITRLKHIQQQLTERNEQLAISNQELAHATRLKDEFLANMSHELRTPLNAILGMSEGLQEQIFGSINEQQMKALQTIERTGFHLLSLINDILDLARVEAGQIDLDYATCDVATLCQVSLDFVKQQALKKQLQLELKLPSSLPDLFVDERRIRQVLVNLLNNAVKFTPKGGQVSVEVTLLTSLEVGDVEKNWLRFAVSDTGIGIAAEDIPTLFQPFVQIDSALNREYEGTGLGLALVKRLVELHGGKVGLTSEVGVGSCFTIDLPGVMTQPCLSEIQDRDVAALDPRPQVGAKSPLILLVENNEDNIVTVAGYLEVKGNRLLVAHNGQEAIALTQSEHPDLILMDIQMPGMDGIEAIRQIRHLPGLGNIPIIALTALAMTGDRDRCLAAGANDYLSKPVKLKQLATTIEQFLTV